MNPKSFVSPLDPVFELLHISPQTDPQVVAKIEAWQKKTGFQFPAVLAEFYQTNCKIPMTVEGQFWNIPLYNLWPEYMEGEFRSLDQIFAAYEHSHQGQWDEELLRLHNAIPTDGKPLVFLQTDVHVIILVFMERDSGDDPILRQYSRETNSWLPETPRFSEWAFGMFADFYQSDYVPSSFWGPDADTDKSEECAPLNMNKSGLWLRAFTTPVAAADIASLKALYPDHSEGTMKSGAICHVFGSDQGWIRLTTDPESHPSGTCSWWIAAETPEALAKLFRSVAKMNDLEKKIRAGTRQGQAVLNAFEG